MSTVTVAMPLPTAEESPPAAPAARTSPIGEEILDASILIVDDRALMRDVIAGCLKKSGFKNLSFAADGALALEALDAVRPDLLILDLFMPNMNGHELCSRLRGDARWRDLPILFQTAADSDQERAHVFEAGATDLVAKPINPPELVARVRIHLENRFLIRRLSQHRARVDAELSAAHKMQEALLPDDTAIREVAARYNLVIRSHYAACSELGGDIWGIRTLDDHRFAFYLTDFSGHGVGAALNTFRLHTFLEHPQIDLDDPGRCLTELNRFLHHTLPTGQFATMFYAVVDIERHLLTYAAAASPSPILGRDGSSGGAELCPSSGLPIGVANGTTYESRQMPFAPGCYLLVYSDALIETPSAAEPLLPEAKLRSAVETCAGEHGSSELVKFLTDYLARSSDFSPHDDLTMACIGRPRL